MKKACTILLIMAMVFAAAGCASAPAANRAANTPDWLNDMPGEDVIWGIGTAKQSTPSMSMTTAEARARVAIARQLDAKVQAMFVDYNQDAGSANSQANASMQQNVSREVTNINVSGARPIKRWQAPDGTWWFLVEYKKSDARSAVAGILNNQAAQYAEFKAQQALSFLDAQLKQNERPMQVNE